MNSFQTITSETRAAVEQTARQQGFAAAGIAALPEPGSDADERQRARFAEWIAAGRMGEMAWLARRNEAGTLVRSSLHEAVPWARSVVLCAFNYNADAPRSTDPAPQGAGWIARYAWSGTPREDGTLKPSDYHDTLLARLRVVEAEVRRMGGEGVQTRCYVDTGPVVERHIAQLAGIGWIGKNTCVLNQELGSWLLLGVVLTSLPLAEDAVLLPAADRCGTCTRCIDACPTDALIAPRQMDARRCISYLTIEKKGSIAEDLREGMGRQVFGCDICQDVCPWNRRAPLGGSDDMQPRRELVNMPLDTMAERFSTEFNALFRGSPLERTGRKRLLRNIAVAMGNSGEERYLPRLDAWREAEDPVLAEAAGWAARKIRSNHEGSAVLQLTKSTPALC